MSDTDPVERAKADRAEVLRMITQYDTEIARLNQLRLTQTQQRDRLTAFIDLYAKYTAPIVSPPVAAPGVTPPTQAKAEAAPAAAEKPASTVATAVPKLRKLKAKRRSGIPRKPVNIPPMPDMIKAVLVDAALEGVPGLTPKRMQEFIAKKWWPTVKAGQISPIAWRMFDRGQLKRDGDLYVLPGKNAETEADVSPAPAKATTFELLFKEAP